jgi:lysyl-tRNA synthetase class 2
LALSTIENSSVLIHATGRVTALRHGGTKLVFLDIEASGPVQAVVQLGHLENANPDFDYPGFRAFRKAARAGDAYMVTGHAHRTFRGELSILASETPKLLAPCLHQVPTVLDDASKRAVQPHVDMLVNPIALQTIRVRHHVERAVTNFLDDRGFTKVTTPILCASAGGANARPFETVATELSNEKLQLRVAPELWLKRLIVGGFRRVYELGPAFRNEGVDQTHNPEFQICEFYQAYATLDDLMTMTEELLRSIDAAVGKARSAEHLPFIEECKVDFKSAVFQRAEFIPALSEKIGQPLPNLDSPTATDDIISLFSSLRLAIPASPTLPRLLDVLAGHFLEPASKEAPLFITNHPACMSPLAKHFVCVKTGQNVAARAELFIEGREYANMYEEENSPFAQEEKFDAQHKLRGRDAEAMAGDEGYVRVLEWGLPPTGGWGCGIERLVMLFAGRERIADVMPFGHLRNVVALGKVARGKAN